MLCWMRVQEACIFMCEQVQFLFNIMKKTIVYQYYERDTIFPYGEDIVCEFKGHKCLAVEEIPPWCYTYGGK